MSHSPQRTRPATAHGSSADGWIDVTVPIRDGWSTGPTTPPCASSECSRCRETTRTCPRSLSALTPARTWSNSARPLPPGGGRGRRDAARAGVRPRARGRNRRRGGDPPGAPAPAGPSSRRAHPLPDEELAARVARGSSWRTPCISRWLRRSSSPGAGSRSWVSTTSPWAATGAATVRRCTGRCSTPACEILEGLDLADAPEGPCELACLPLRIAGGDGAPARALVRPLARGDGDANE